MRRILVHVEGVTEETFVNEVLRPHLSNCLVSARLVGNARQRARRGGIRSWLAVRSDIVNHLKEDAGCYATTMVDYYGMPKTGQKAWPGREAAERVPFDQKAPTIHNALLSNVRGSMGPAFNPDRFIPFVLMHEFEALLFQQLSRIC